MDRTTIIQLINRYFEGTTSLEEEAQISAYFNGGGVVEDDLLMYQPLFQSISLEKELQLPPTFDQLVLDQLEEDSNGRVISLKPWRRWMSVAAGVAVLLVGLLWILSPPTTTTETAAIDWSQYEPGTPEEAMELYKMAIMKVGSSLNEGAKTAASKVQRIDEVVQFFE